MTKLAAGSLERFAAITGSELGEVRDWLYGQMDDPPDQIKALLPTPEERKASALEYVKYRIDNSVTARMKIRSEVA